ncbi:LOW QUALITY PROTEIN: X-box-binding protein 1 [Rhinoderma darwinii]|uniref:LOW QUALITY PROTEIN: X-box-binding protein 1 n=1 Tax=Rhinoderma darwinii TaxID=43563 RepID=UPI003F665FC0
MAAVLSPVYNILPARAPQSFSRSSVLPSPPYPDMVVMGASKVIFIPGNQSEQSNCKSLTSVMLPIHSPSSPESVSGDIPPRKRQRLTHLTPEEKALRRKLKNRVAAQTARDRKKARMGELEQQVLDLEIENEKLLIENELLREKSHGLLTENQELRQRLGLDALEVKEEEEVEVKVLTQSREDEVRPVTGSAERSTQTMCLSAAGAGPVVSELDHVCMDSDSPDSSDCESDILLGLLESLESDLLVPYEENLSWNQQEEVNGDESDSISSAPSSPLGTPSIKLEAINELIKFDHVYTKPLCSEQDSELGIETSVVIKTEEASLNPCIVPSSVKQESQGEVPAAIDTHSFLISAEDIVEKPANLVETGSDSGYEGCTSPFSDMSSPLSSDQTWEDSFTTELFPQLLNVHMHQSCSPSPLGDPTLFWNPSPDFDDEPF